MISVPIYNKAGQQVGQKQVDETQLGLSAGQEPNHDLLKQAVVTYQANARLGTQRTQNRGEVAGSTRKLYKQKGTGRARAGTVRTPTRKGGGHAFQKLPRDFGRTLTADMRRQALKHAVYAKLKSGQIILVDDFTLTTPKTQAVASLFKALKVAGSVTLATAGVDPVVYKSGRNLPRTTVRPAADLTALDVIQPRSVVFTVPAFEGLLAKRLSNGAGK